MSGSSAPTGSRSRRAFRSPLPGRRRARQGSPVLAELEVAWRLIEAEAEVESGAAGKNRWVAVTGTNGKSTTTSWIADILKRAGRPVALAGNIGSPLSGFLSAPLLSDRSVSLDAADQLLGPSHGAGLAPAVLRALSASLQSGLSVVFWVIAGIALAAALTSLLFPNLPVVLGQQEQQAHVGEPAGMTAVPPEP